MALPPFPEDAISLTDFELGGLLIGYYIAYHAESVGLPLDGIPDEFGERVRQLVLTQEVSTARNAAVEKALHKAANGDFVTSGRIIREHLERGALQLKYMPIGIRKSEQAKEFGLEGSKAKKRIYKGNRQKILEAAQNILATRIKNVSERELANKISAKTGIKFGTVRDHLPKLKAEGHIKYGS